MTTTQWKESGRTQVLKTKFSPAYGATVEFFAGGTTTPLTVYTERTGATPAETGNLTVDSNGAWPDLFIPYGDYRYRIKDSAGNVIVFTGDIPNPQPFDETVATDPNAVLNTGDMWFSPIAGTRDGAVRANGRTIGNGSSSATERANADTSDLFSFLWTNLADAQAAVSGGRGASAAADFAANKTITLLDMRGAGPLGLDDMGNSAASLLDSASFAHGDATTAGSEVGANTLTLIEANLPAHTHAVGTIAAAANGGHLHSFSGTTSAGSAHSHGVNDPTHSHTVNQYRTVGNQNIASPSSTFSYVNPAGGDTGVASVAAFTGISINNEASHTHPYSGNVSTVSDHTHTLSGSTASVGSGTAASTVSRAILGTWFIKL